MKKVLFLISCFAVVFVLSNVSFAQPASPQLTVAGIVADGGAVPAAPAPQMVPFGYPPYATAANGYPAYGVPYSYPRGFRRQSRLSPPPVQPYPLPAPGLPVPLVGQPGGTQPQVYHRPTPIKNFITLLASPRPYIGYDPYAGGYPPFPGYQPPQ
jgi:hypothetical protein